MTNLFEHEGISRGNRNDIAVIAMCCKFPGADTVEQFEANLFAGVESIRRFSDEELAAAGVPSRIRQSETYVPARSCIEGIDQFDAHFFGYSPREAELMDPQQRLFLEHAHALLEQGGYDPFRYAGRIGVFAGTAHNGYFFHHVWGALSDGDDSARLEAAIANDKDHLATRVAYKLNLRGPAVTVQTACSTSLVAICMAVEALRSGGADMAMAGGVSVSPRGNRGYIHRQGGILSKDGRCRPFDAAGSGTVFGDGLGIVLLKRLEDALRDGDTIHAVVKGAAINNDGANKVGYTAPSVEGQRAVVRAAFDAAGVAPEQIGFVEAHGTATAMGDPIEFRALREAFGSGAAHPNQCALGSVKANVGHLNAAAGVAGFIKAVITVRRGEIPPHPTFEELNPHISFSDSPFFINTATAPWPLNLTERIAGVSSFGMGGTNAHAIVAAAPTRARHPGDEKRTYVLPLSAKSLSALEQLATNVARELQRPSSPDLHDVALTLQQGRRQFAYRAAVVARDIEDAARLMAEQSAAVTASSARPRRVAFLFPGQGIADRGEARFLHEASACFRREFARCAQLFEAQLGFDIRSMLFPAETVERGAAADLSNTLHAQPFFFSTAYAFAHALREWGVEPAAVVGHSLGEYVAATVAGVFTLEDAVDVVAHRARLMAEAPEGRMLFVALDEERCREVIGSLRIEADIAAINAPGECVVAGEVGGLECVAQHLGDQCIAHVFLKTTRAFHSRAMGLAAHALSTKIGQKKLGTPGIRTLSNVSGTWAASGELSEPNYWARHACLPVRFMSNVSALIEDGIDVLIEVGVGGTLRRMVDNHPGRQQIETAGVEPEASEPVASLVARLWELGVDIDWQAFGHSGAGRVALPTYPFERQSFWIEAHSRGSRPASTEADATSGPPDDRGYVAHTVNWTQLPPLSFANTDVSGEQWLMFGADDMLTRALMHELNDQAPRVILVQAGPQLDLSDPHRPFIRMTEPDDYVALFRSLAGALTATTRIVHLWAARPVSALDAREDFERCFYSLLWMTRAMGETGVQTLIDATIVVEGLHKVESGDASVPARATVVGPRNVIPRERENVSMRTIDIVATDLDAGDSRMLAQRILAEVQGGAECNTVALRGETRWTRVLERVSLPAGESADCSKAGQVWVITGGLGGLGLALAEHVAAGKPAAIVLLSRRAFPANEQWTRIEDDEAGDASTRLVVSRLAAIAKSGVQVEVRQCDIGNARDVDETIDVIWRKRGRIDVVVHAAGIAGGGIAELCSRSDVEAVWHPKIAGTAALMSSAVKAGVKAVILCSSNDALRGGAGQVGYVAANAYLDATACNGGRMETPVYSINWPSLGDGGMAYESRKAHGVLRGSGRQLKANWLPLARAGEIVDGVLGQLRRQISIAVEHIYLEPFGHARQACSSGPSAHAGEPPRTMHAHGQSAQAMPKAARRLHARPASLDVEYAAPQSEVEHAMAEIWSSLLGIAGIGLDDNFFALGGHSLLAVRLTFRIREVFGVDFGLSQLFGNPTVRASAEEITRLQLAAVPEQEMLALLSRIEALDDELG